MRHLSNTFALLALFCFISPTGGQDFERPFAGFGQQFGNPLDLSFTAGFEAVDGEARGRVWVKTSVPKGSHLYSTYANNPSPLAIVPRTNQAFKIDGVFRATPKGRRHYSDDFQKEVEEHRGSVTWVAPVSFSSAEVDFDHLEIPLSISGQVCSDPSQDGHGGSCKPFETLVAAKFTGFYQTAKLAAADAKWTKEFKRDDSHAIWTGEIDSGSVAAGGEVNLKLSAKVTGGYYLYHYLPQKPKGIYYSPTMIRFNPVGISVGDLKESSTAIYEEETESYHYKGDVELTIPITLAADASGKHTISGLVAYQTCVAGKCDYPRKIAFRAVVEVGEGGNTKPIAVEFAESKTTIKQFKDGIAPEIAIKSTDNSRSFLFVLVVAMMGGFILNFMPCVLPVIGLKVMAFIEQAGEKKSRILSLNFAYVAGILSIFMVLATLVAFTSFGWGTQNQNTTFNIVMVSIIFTMSLSFLGVWEIPIPGFASSGKAARLAEKEGLTGAFAKGIVTTLLAVPCSAPGIGVALSWCLNREPIYIYGVFAAMGLGMALPFIVIAFNPNLMKFLPRPGAWMETFKQIMGFVLLGTVVWIFSYMDKTMVVPTLGFLFSLWFCCWWIGRTPLTAERMEKINSYAVAIAFGFFFGWLNLSVLSEANNPYRLDWEDYSETRLAEELEQNKTVMVDFTADWCLNCKVLERTVLNTKEVKEMVNANGIVPLIADWTNRNESIARKLVELKAGKQIPVLAIYPANDPDNPIVFSNGAYTKKQLIEKLQQATEAQAKSLTANPRSADVLETSMR